MSATTGTPEGARVRRTGRLGREPLDPEVATACTLSTSAVARADRARRSRQPVSGWWCRRRPGVAPDCSITSGTRNAPPISTLSPRDDEHLPARRQRAEHEQHRGRVVVHDDRRLGAGRARARSRPTPVCREPRRPDARSNSTVARHGVDGDSDIGRPAQVGVEQDPGGIHHRLQQGEGQGPGVALELAPRAVVDGADAPVRRGPGAAVRTRPPTGRAGRPTVDDRGRAPRSCLGTLTAGASGCGGEPALPVPLRVGFASVHSDGPVLFLVFIVAPIVELYVLLQVSTPSDSSTPWS